MNRKVSLLIPCYNEQESLPIFYPNLCSVIDKLSSDYEFEIIFINDGSKDDTINILRQFHKNDSRVNFIDLSRNYGKEIAMLAGMDYASGDAVITLDADLQEPPEVIPEMINKWVEGYDDVYGQRETRQQSKTKILFSRTYHKALAMMAEIPFEPDAGDFRLLDRKCINALRSMRETQRYTKGLYSLIGFNKAAVKYNINQRVAGKTKWNFRALCKLAIDGITAHSLVPLRFASFAGIFVSFAAFIFLAWVIIKALIWGDPVAGYPSLMAVILFIGGTILLALGIIGEYLGRIFMETKRRPPYFINSINDKNV